MQQQSSRAGKSCREGRNNNVDEYDEDDDDDRKPPARPNWMISASASPSPNNFDSDSELVEKSCITADGSFASNSTTSESFIGIRKPTTTTKNHLPVDESLFTTGASKAIKHAVNGVSNTANSTINRSYNARMMIYSYVGTIIIGWGIILIHVLPSVVLYAISWMGMSTVIMFYYSSVYLFNYMQQYYDDTVIRGNGIGTSVLPSSLYNTLTRATLHELLSDDTMILEYRHVMLYFLPISPTQRDRLLQSIAPNHIQQLHQRGTIGSVLLGESIMRLLLGYQQYDQLYGNANAPPPRQQHQLTAASTTTDNSTAPHITVIGTSTLRSSQQQEQPQPQQAASLLLSDDEASDLGLDISADDLIDDHHATTTSGALYPVISGAAAGDRSFNNQGEIPIPSIVINNHGTTTLPNEVVTTTTVSSIRAESSSNNVRNEMYDNLEYQILIDGLWETFYNTFYNPMSDYVTSRYFIPSLQRLQSITFYSGVILLSFSSMNFIGLPTLIGSWSYAHFRRLNLLPSLTASLTLSDDRERAIPSQQILSQESHISNGTGVATMRLPMVGVLTYSYPNTTTWYTFVLGTASFGISYYSRQYVRRYYATNTNVTASNSTRSYVNNNFDSTTKKNEHVTK